MKIITEISLREFKPWCGAEAVYSRFTIDELDQIEELLNDLKETWTNIEINDIFWFDDDRLLEMLNINPDEFWKRERGK